MGLDYGDIEKLSQTAIDNDSWEDGDRVFNTTLGLYQDFDGTSWLDDPLGGDSGTGGGAIITINDVKTFKTISLTQSVNASTAFQTILFATGVSGDVFSAVPNGVVLLKDLFNVEVNVSLYYESLSARVNNPVAVSIDGFPSNIESGTSYIRAASGHNNASCFVSEVYESLPAGTVITGVVRRDGNTGTVTSIAGKGMLSVMGNTSDASSSINDLLTPVITAVNPIAINNGATEDITISGAFFMNSTTVTVGGSAVNSVTFISPTELLVNVTAGTTDGFYDVAATNPSGSYTLANSIEITTSTWIDLRLGGDVFTDGNGAGNDIRYQSAMSMSRDASGMFFTGTNPWASWVKFESLGWTRGDLKTLQWIITPATSFMMVGIGSDATDENNGAQYAQAECEAYFSNATTMWGLYGNNGTPGVAGNQSQSTNYSGYPAIKIKLENDGEVGEQFTLYGLNSTSPGDWDDETNVITTIVIGGTINPDEPNIMPFIIPRADTQRFLALKVE